MTNCFPTDIPSCRRLTKMPFPSNNSSVYFPGLFRENIIVVCDDDGLGEILISFEPGKLPSTIPVRLVKQSSEQAPNVQPCARCFLTSPFTIQISLPLWHTITLSFLLPQRASITVTVISAEAVQPYSLVAVTE